MLVEIQNKMTNRNFCFISSVQYDKNLLQSNSHSINREIPIDGYFAFGEITNFSD